MCVYRRQGRGRPFLRGGEGEREGGERRRRTWREGGVEREAHRQSEYTLKCGSEEKREDSRGRR